MEKDPYQILGVPPNASEEEIRRAYRRRAREWHPDLHPDDPYAEQRMKDLNAAYAQLTRPEPEPDPEDWKDGAVREDRSGYRSPQAWRVVLGFLCRVFLAVGAAYLVTGLAAGTLGRWLDPPQTMVIPLTDQVSIRLDSDWRLVENHETDTDWYRVRRGVSTAFRVNTNLPAAILGQTPEEWTVDMLDGLRAFLLETFVAEPGDEVVSFLTDLRIEPDAPEGMICYVSEGMGRSNGGTWNHFLVIFLPEYGCVINVQSSSWKMNQQQLEDYVEKWILSLPQKLVAAGQS